MNCNFEIDHKTHDATLNFKFSDFKDLRSHQDALTLIFIICADYQLDPELELEDFQGIIESSKESGKEGISFFISEDGLEAQPV